MNVIGEFFLKIIVSVIMRKTAMESMFCPTMLTRIRPFAATIFCSKSAAYVVSNAAVDAIMACQIVFLCGRLFFCFLSVHVFVSYIWDDKLYPILADTCLNAGSLLRIPAASASFPSCSPSPLMYDVFISFRGSDSRDDLASDIYYALRRAGVKTFMDHDLEKGEEIAKGLFDAIEGSKISVVVLSENYASSPWCLDELTQIMERRRRKRRGHIVLPVFYGVKPREVRRQTGRYEAALAMHQSRSQEEGMAEKVKKWREALTEIANLFGYDSDVVRPKAKLVNDVVEDVLKRLKNPALIGSSPDG